MSKIKNATVFIVFAIIITAFALLPLYTEAGSGGKKEAEEEVVEKEMGPPPETIRFGAGLQLSGWAVGDTELAHTQPYEMWIEQLNKQGGIYVKDYDMRIPVELTVYDTESDIGKTVRMYEKLILEDKVDILLPPWATAYNFAIVPIVEQHKYPVIGTTESSEQLREALREGKFNYYFGMWNPASVVGTELFKLLKDVGVESAAVIFVGTTYGIDQSAVVSPLLAREGIAVKLIESYPLGVADLSPLLKKIQDINPDALLAISYPQDAMLIQQQLQVIDFNPQLFYNALSGYPLQRDRLGADAAEGMLSEGAWNENWDTRGSKQFYKDFWERWNREPAWDTAITWASLQMWEDVLREVGLDREAQREFIANTTFDTIDGKVKFTNGENVHTGDPDGAYPPVFGQWQNGVFEVVWPKDISSSPLIHPKPEWP
jgi:branched-chain amino acid transport system substrate-binding protein